jgi:hypothetical protein
MYVKKNVPAKMAPTAFAEPADCDWFGDGTSLQCRAARMAFLGRFASSLEAAA